MIIANVNILPDLILFLYVLKSGELADSDGSSGLSAETVAFLRVCHVFLDNADSFSCFR